MCERAILSPSARRPRTETLKKALAVRLHQALRPGPRRPGRVPAGAAGAVLADPGKQSRPGRALLVYLPTSSRPPGRRSITQPSPKVATSCPRSGPIGQIGARIAPPPGGGEGLRHRQRPRAPGDGPAQRGRSDRQGPTATTSAAALRELTDGRGPDSTIDAVGMAAHERRAPRWSRR